MRSVIVKKCATRHGRYARRPRSEWARAAAAGSRAPPERRRTDQSRRGRAPLPVEPTLSTFRHPNAFGSDRESSRGFATEFRFRTRRFVSAIDSNFITNFRCETAIVVNYQFDHYFFMRENLMKRLAMPKLTRVFLFVFLRKY